jgi:SEC-C motif domain protein
MTHCPCHSQKPYDKCCKPFHDGALPKNALELMRSRYSAYALNLADYIIKTTHPSNPHYTPDHRAWKESIDTFSKSTDFRGLTIHEFTEDQNRATVIFTATLFQGEADVSFTERSTFEKVGPTWYYTGAISLLI